MESRCVVLMQINPLQVNYTKISDSNRCFIILLTKFEHQDSPFILIHCKLFVYFTGHQSLCFLLKLNSYPSARHDINLYIIFWSFIKLLEQWSSMDNWIDQRTSILVHSSVFSGEKWLITNTQYTQISTQGV